MPRTPQVPRPQHGTQRLSRTPSRPDLREPAPPRSGGRPLVGPGSGGMTLRQLEQDRMRLERIVELLPKEEVLGAVRRYAAQAEPLTQAFGGSTLLGAVLDQIGASLGDEEQAALRSELEQELGGPLDHAREVSWIEREAEHARREVTRHWVDLVLTAIDHRDRIALDEALRPVSPDADESDEALLASVALRREELASLMTLFRANLNEAVSRTGRVELPGGVAVVLARSNNVGPEYRPLSPTEDPLDIAEHAYL